MRIVETERKKMNFKKTLLAFVTAVTVMSGLVAEDTRFSYEEIQKTAEEFQADAKKLEETLNAARKGDVDSQLKLAFVYMYDENPEAQIAAYSWFRRAAEKRNMTGLLWFGHCHAYGIGTGKNMNEAIKWYKKAAEKGSVKAPLVLGYIYLYGKDEIKSSPPEAVKMFRKAAEKGNAEAMAVLGHCYIFGFGVKADKAEGLKLLQNAAEKGEAGAMLFLAKLSFDAGKEKESFEWCKKAADLGNTKAMVELARYYLFGIGVKVDKAEGMKLLHKAAEKDETGAMLLLADVSFKSGKEKESFEWYKKAADLGDPNAIFGVGRCYIAGSGVKKDEQAGMKLLLKSAELGCVEAQYFVGIAYLEGVILKENKTEAEKFFKKAADQGHPDAMVELGNICIAQKKVKEGVALYQKAAELGNAEAMHNLSGHYFIGYGVKRDYDKGMKLLLKSAELGYEPAIKKVQEMKKLMKE